MVFDVITFKELLGMNFNIPSYQRGYRWEKENVVALLDDIQEFAIKKKDIGEFYCLQPVVVKKNITLSEQKGEDVYDLLDGQQRLTTLWLILNSPNFSILWNALDPSHKNPYSLQYESRNNLFNEAINSNADPLDNIDLFYLKNAFSAINNWSNGNPLDIINTIVPKDINQKSDNVRIIWYEFNNENNNEKKQSNSIKVFSRLNYGKIALTDTELIKALILQSDIYPLDESKHNRYIMKEYLFRIATEWDDIEKGLHNDQLWGMLTPKDYNPANHMELLLRFVADQIQAKYKYKIIDHQRPDFHIISNFLGIGKNIVPDEYAVNVEKLWNMILDAYNCIHNWYTNDNYYHLIGLLSLLQSGSNPMPLIKNIYENYSDKQKNQKSFREYLEGEVGKAIIISEKIDESTVDCKRLLKLHELEYGSNSSRIIKVLEAFNVFLYLNKECINSRFDFNKFKDKKVTSLEHIHPQHLNFQNGVKYDDVKLWFDTTKDIILSNVEYNQDNNLAKTLEKLDKLLKDKEEFQHQINNIQAFTETIDAFFDNKANMNSGHMHTLYNMALIDKDTNASLSNNLIDKKRKILQDREREGKTYVPIATNYVFNKHFSDEISEMKFWSKKDRDQYFDKISEAYNYFVNKIIYDL